VWGRAFLHYLFMMFKAFLRMLIFRREWSNSEMLNGNMVCVTLETYLLFDDIVKKANHII